MFDDYKLNEPFAGSNPAGSCLEYSPAFLSLIDLVQTQPEQQYGSILLAAREPDWREVYAASLSLAQQTRDLRVAVHLVESATQLHQWSGLAAGLQHIEYLITELWNDVHPQLDADDSDDATARLGAIAHLTSTDGLLRSINNASIVEHRSQGKLNLRSLSSIVIASDEQSSHTFTRAHQLQVWFEASSRSWIEQQIDQLTHAIKSIDMIDRFLVKQLGMQAWSAKTLVRLLDGLRDIYREQLDLNPHSVIRSEATLPESIVVVSTPAAQVASLVPATTAEVTSQPVAPNTLAIHTREDAIAALNNICKYFELHEPASPVPLLLKRAMRLIPMSFVDILRELAPSEMPTLLQQFMGSTSSPSNT
jgi:type VI secretion system protein ImpA